MLNHLHGGQLSKPASNSKVVPNGQLLVFNQDAFINPPASLSTGNNLSAVMTQWISTSMALHQPEHWPRSISGFFNAAMPAIAVPLKDKTTSRRSSLSFDEQGFVYFPSACTNGRKCPIHVALHGCQQGTSSLRRSLAFAARRRLAGKAYVGDTFAVNAGYLEVAELNNIIVVIPQAQRSLVFPTNPMGCWDWWGYSSLFYATRGAPQMLAVKSMIDTVRLVNAAFVTAQ